MKWMKKNSGTVEAQPRRGSAPMPDCVHQMARVLSVYSGILTELNRPRTSSSSGDAGENARA